MFSIFAARMFEQRVLQAYREKVAQDRQLQLIKELEEEDRAAADREAKKKKDAEKKKDKKKYVAVPFKRLYSKADAVFAPGNRSKRKRRSSLARPE